MFMSSFRSFLIVMGMFGSCIITGDASPTVSCLSSSTIKFLVYQRVTPLERTHAGRYSKYESAKTLEDCVQVCCVTRTCNVVFFHNGQCFLITCADDRACAPEERIGSKFENSYMVQVRPVSLHSVSEGDTEDSPSWEDAYKFPKSTMSLYDEDFTLPDEKRKNGERSSETHRREEIPPQICIPGKVNECLDHQYCAQSSNHQRGICVCDKGFVYDTSAHRCIVPSNGIKSLSLDPSDSAPVSTVLSSFGSVAANRVGDDSTSTSAPSTNLTSSTSQPTIATIHHLVVSAGEDKLIHLPENEVTLSAFVVPNDYCKTYKYEWQLISHPEGDEMGLMQGQSTSTLKLSKLRTGVYTVKVVVTCPGADGESRVNITVLPPVRVNKHPVAIIQPSNVTVQLPNKDTVLDGSYSTDDDKIVQYHWEAVSVPIGYQIQPNDTPTLQLKNLIPGLYQLKLTVLDSDGASNFTMANVTVLKEMDYPPTANAGNDVVIFLPKDEVYLNGNLSTDDKGIKSWQWTKSPDTENRVDMEGTDTPYLKLSKLQKGVYKFMLKVTDTANQSSTAEVHVFVKPENNLPPTADAGKDQRVSLPLDKPVVLDGRQSHDDVSIQRWHWEQIKGPKPARLAQEDKPQTNVTGLIPGEYTFQLTVTDSQGINSSAQVHISVTQAKNTPPQANAGGDQTVNSPCIMVMLNGSQSWDDVGIVSYQWTREPASLAFGDVVENSDKSPVLKLVNLIPGRYLFRLTVTDAQGVTGSDAASLIVKPAINLRDQVELVVNADIKSFSKEQEETLLRKLELLLQSGNEPIRVRVVKLDYDRHTRRVMVIFVVEKNVGKELHLVPGTEVVSHLKHKLKADSSLLDLEVLSLDTVVCQNNCSNHGSCDHYTRRCVCEAFWMEDTLRVHFGDQESNCDWSILYVIIIAFIVVVSAGALIWSIACCCTRMRFRKPRKRHRYTLLEDYSDKEKERYQLMPKANKLQNSSLMLSDSESDSLFEARQSFLNNKNNSQNKPINGLVRNVRKVRA